MVEAQRSGDVRRLQGRDGAAGSVTDQAPVVEVQDAYYAIRGRPIFNGVSMRVRRGSITALMGPSGTGKTTLLRLIMGQVRTQSGSVKVFGEDVEQLSRSQLFALRRRVG